MWSQGSNKRATARAAASGRLSSGAAMALVLLGGCHSAPPQPARPAPVPAQPAKPVAPPPAAAAKPAAAPGAASANTQPKPAAAAQNAAATGATGATAASGAAAVATPVRPVVPPAANADFARAVGYMRAGNATEAELGFKQIALEYPQFAAPLTNLGILYRKTGRLDDSEKALRSAVEHEPASAAAWTELGVTQRMRGEFKDAAASYEQATTADPEYAPAWRNLGVVSDLYLGDPQRALTALTRYQELTHEERPVSGWIAGLRQRLAMPPVKRPEAAPAAPAEPGTTPAQAAPNEAPAKTGAGG